MITHKELLEPETHPENYEVSLTHAKAFTMLAIIINMVRKLYGKPMVITNCIRSWLRHVSIYANLTVPITDESKIPSGSKHLSCEAVDILDLDGKLYQWCVDHEAELTEIGVWIEADTKGWVHFQIVPYGSWEPGKTIFFKA